MLVALQYGHGFVNKESERKREKRIEVNIPTLTHVTVIVHIISLQLLI